MNEIDIEALKQELKQTQLAYQMAAQMNQFKAGFLARTAHELRSPLNSIIGLHQLILSDLCESPEEEREFITQAYNNTLKLLKLLDEVIGVSKTEYGTEKLEISPLQLANVLEEVHRLTHLQAANRGIQLEISFPNPQLYILADYRRFLQVLVMLVETSLAKMGSGTIEVSTHLPSASDVVQINIDVQGCEPVWSEPAKLLENQPTSPPEAANLHQQTPNFSPEMKLLLSQTLLDVMQGSLEVTTASSQSEQDTATQLQCLVPLAPAETVAQELKQNE